MEVPEIILARFLFLADKRFVPTWAQIFTESREEKALIKMLSLIDLRMNDFSFKCETQKSP